MIEIVSDLFILPVHHDLFACHVELALRMARLSKSVPLRNLLQNFDGTCSQVGNTELCGGIVHVRNLFCIASLVPCGVAG